MQPYFFPYLGYFQGIHAVDTFLLYDQVGYIKNGWVNRNRVLAPGQAPTYVTVPLHKTGKSAHTLIRDVRTADTPWRAPLLERLHHTYRRSPHFSDVFPLVEAVLSHPTDRLAALNRAGIQAVVTLLQIDTHLEDGTHGLDRLEEHLRAEPLSAEALPDEALPRRVARIRALCRHFGADTYVNAIGGRALYDKDVFRSFGVALHFVQMRPVRYPQPTDAFHPNLSILDVLMRCGVDGTRALLPQYDLV